MRTWCFGRKVLVNMKDFSIFVASSKELDQERNDFAFLMKDWDEKFAVLSEVTHGCQMCAIGWKPGRDEAEWSANLGKWVIPLHSEHEAKKLALQEHRDESPEELPF